MFSTLAIALVSGFVICLVVGRVLGALTSAACLLCGTIAAYLMGATTLLAILTALCFAIGAALGWMFGTTWRKRSGS